MITEHKKTYGKPLMVVQEFVPNEYVASCLMQSRTRYHGGTLFFDYNNNGFYDAGEGKGTGESYSGHTEMIDAGNFEIVERGRAMDGGGLGYLFVGSGSFDYNEYPHTQDGTWDSYYNYSGSNYIPAYYAILRIHYPHYTQENVKIYLAVEDDGTGIITNAS